MTWHGHGMVWYSRHGPEPLGQTSLSLCNRHVPFSVVRHRNAVIGAVPGYMGRPSGVGVYVSYIFFFTFNFCLSLSIFSIFYFQQGYPGDQIRIKGWQYETSKPFLTSLVYVSMCLYISGQMDRWLDEAVKGKGNVLCAILRLTYL